MTYAGRSGRDSYDKLSALVTERHGDVRGGMSIRRGDLAEGCAEFADRIVAAIALH